MNQAMTRLTPNAVAELRTLSPRMLAGLPLATELRVKLPGHGTLATFRVAGTAGTTSAPTFDAAELVAIADAVEHGRAHAADLERWCEQKEKEPAFRVTPEVALAGAASLSPSSWSLGAVLREIDAMIVEAAIAEDATLDLPVAA